MTVRVGLIGLGAIGTQVLDAFAAGTLPGVDIPAVLVRTPREGRWSGTAVTADADRFFAEHFDAVFECAGHQAVREHGQRALASGADLYITAVGALTNQELFDGLLATAKAIGRRIVLPSAGIGALDILSAAAVGGLDSVRITVRKDPESWKGTAGERLCDLEALRQPFTLYDGPVREGARLYPQNVNISAATALAGIGLDRTQVIIVADPTITSHVVEIEAVGAFGRFHFVEDVLPTESNRKTGRIVGMAIVKTIRQLGSPLVVGA